MKTFQVLALLSALKMANDNFKNKLLIEFGACKYYFNS